MRKFSEEREKFIKENVDISKWEFAHKAYEQYHYLLWDYARALNDTDLGQIILTKDGVIMQLNDNDVCFYCREADERSMMLDMLNFKTYEKEYMKIIDLILTNLTSRTILDIGANMGYTSCMWGKKFPDACVFSFEPILSTYELFLRNIELNNLHNVTPFNLGISNMNGETDFFFYPWCTANTSIMNLQHRDDSVKNRAEIKKLDDLQEIQGVSIDFIKCDVEGNELHVIEGATKLIETYLPVICVEILRKYSDEFGYQAMDVVNAIRYFGYEMYCIKEGQLMLLNEITDETEECNFIFLHSQKHKVLVSMLGE